MSTDNDENNKSIFNGYDVLHNGKMNKSTAFSLKERDEFGLRGLLPYSIGNQERQMSRVMANVRRKAFDIERYIFLSALQERNERLFYRTVLENIEEVMPLIYTPTIGQACKEFGQIYRQPKGFYINPEDKGDIGEILANWPDADVRVIVITDGQRVLGLGDLGANGMGIPIGKLALYVACAGVHPDQCLPVMFDAGTNNESLLDDPLYLGYPHKRIDEIPYLELMAEFVDAVQKRFPNALIQFEDFLTPNAYSLLNEYREKVLCFNDDIQGTAAVTLAGVYASTRITGQEFKRLRIMFLGAGSAATGIADLMVSALMQEGLSKTEARRQLWFVDTEGLLVASRIESLMPHNLSYAHNHPELDFLSAIEEIKPHVLIGATGAAGTFTQDVIEAMTRLNDRPAIFALSNPTENAECTAEQAYKWSGGKAVFTSGSPFGSLVFEGQALKPGQGNNAYIFPGIGLGAISCLASKISDEMFLSAASTLAGMVTDADLKTATLYPRLTNIREISLQIAIAVAEQAYEQELAVGPKPVDMRKFIESKMYDPHY